MTVPRPEDAGSARRRTAVVPDDKLALYHFEGCPYCARVRAALADLDVEVELRDIREEPRHFEALGDAVGRTTVPVLRFDTADGETRWLPESADIVRYLRETYPARST